MNNHGLNQTKTNNFIPEKQSSSVIYANKMNFYRNRYLQEYHPKIRTFSGNLITLCLSWSTCPEFEQKDGSSSIKSSHYKYISFTSPTKHHPCLLLFKLICRKCGNIIKKIWHLILFPSNLMEIFLFDFNTAESNCFSFLQYRWFTYTVNVSCVDLTKKFKGNW